MNKLCLALAATLTISAAPAVASAADYAVCSSGCLFSDIQSAIDMAASDNDGADTIYVYPGSYQESLNVSHGSAFTIRAMSTSMGTVDIIGDGLSPVLTVASNADVTLRRLDLSEGGGMAGVVNYGQLKMVKTYVLDCDGDWGGIGNFGGNLTVKKFSVVAANSGEYGGGGISNLSGTLLVDNATITGNHGYLGGGIHNSWGTTTVSASSLSFNLADSLGGAWSNHNIGGVVDFQASSSYSSNTASDCDKYYDVDATPQCIN